MSLQREIVTSLELAELPPNEVIPQVRIGKPQKLAHDRSAIFKQEQLGPVFCGPTGLIGDAHVYEHGGGIQKAVHMYSAIHYPRWKEDIPQSSHFFEQGAFGENLPTTRLHESNVCIGDIFQVGNDGLLLEVSEPRTPCYKLNLRFEFPRTQKKAQSTGRIGWHMRVLHTGHVQRGDSIILVKRPNPLWSVMNVHRVVNAKWVEPQLLQELLDVYELSPAYRPYVQGKLNTTPRVYQLIRAVQASPRVKELTFHLKDNAKIAHPGLHPHTFAKIQFGPNMSIARSYSIIGGDLVEFSLGVALDNHSRGGSEYIHQNLNIGDLIKMAPGNPEYVMENCLSEPPNRIVIIGGIGVTAFLPVIKQWEEQKKEYEVHYAVRTIDDAAFLDRLPPRHTTVYAKSLGERLDLAKVIPDPTSGKPPDIYCCGPTRLMEACKDHVESLKYPDHSLHFESFGVASEGNLGDPFEVEVEDIEDRRSETLMVPSDKSLLRVLTDAGFDVMSLCQAGVCGACKLTLCHGQVDYKGKILSEAEKGTNLLSCVDRGIGKIRIEID